MGHYRLGTTIVKSHLVTGDDDVIVLAFGRCEQYYAVSRTTCDRALASGHPSITTDGNKRVFYRMTDI